MSGSVDDGDDLDVLVLNQSDDFILRLPGFKGKARIEAMFRALLKPHISTVRHDIRMELDPEEWLADRPARSGRVEPRTTALFERILRPGDSLRRCRRPRRLPFSCRRASGR